VPTPGGRPPGPPAAPRAARHAAAVKAVPTWGGDPPDPPLRRERRATRQPLRIMIVAFTGVPDTAAINPAYR
jgi:hypothetical protein